MFRIFQEEKIITICMLLFLAVSIFIRTLLGALYQNMIRETDNMASTDNKLLKQCKVKFTNCYQLNNGVSNIPVFVDKFLNRLALGRLSFGTMYHLSGQAMLLSVVTAGIGICKGIMDGRTMGDILPFYIASFLALYLYFSVSAIVDVKERRRVLKINLVDYLENHLSARISVTDRDMEMLYGKRNGRSARVSSDYGKRSIELVPINRNTPAEDLMSENNESRRQNVKEERVEADSRVTGEELEALLQEFLTV